MKSKLKFALLMTAGLLLFTGALLAHHSDAIYDQTRLVTISGTVTRFEFINPHTQIFIDVKDDKGGVQQWTILGAAPNAERRIGWKSDSLKPGDQLTFSGFQYRDGRSIMLYVKGNKASGEPLLVLHTQVRLYQEYMEKYGKKQ